MRWIMIMMMMIFIIIIVIVIVKTTKQLQKYSFLEKRNVRQTHHYTQQLLTTLCFSCKNPAISAQTLQGTPSLTYSVSVSTHAFSLILFFILIDS